MCFKFQYNHNYNKLIEYKHNQLCAEYKVKGSPNQCYYETSFKCTQIVPDMSNVFNNFFFTIFLLFKIPLPNKPLPSYCELSNR